MSRVIRVEDEIFSRLQNLAEPFVDTPSSVIGKLLDFYDAHRISTPAFSENKDAIASKYADIGTTQNIFLAPASDANMKATISRGFSLEKIVKYINNNEKAYLEKNIAGIHDLHCWAMTENSRSRFDEMKNGDLVLFTVKSTGKFTYCGRVVAKLDNVNLGNHLWNDVHTKPWKLIYFLEDVRRISLDKQKLVMELGYDKNFVVPGVIKVDPVKKDTVIARYGSIKAFLESPTIK